MPSMVSRLLFAVALLAVAPLPIAAQPDLLIRDALVVDGSGRPAYSASLRVRDGSIVEIGELEAVEGEEIVEARGLVLAPGFIDTHSHHDVGLGNHPQALAAISQGITTIVVGQDGSSNSPLSTWFSTLGADPPAINVASFSGHGTIRRTVMGRDYRRHATAEELEQMVYLLGREMQAGALGLSSGLEYDPGIYASTDEMIAMGREAARHGGRYISHMRSEDRDFWQALEEHLRIGREAQVPVQISHMKLAMKSLWGQADRLAQRLDEARRNGIDVTADAYPYTFWQSTMTVLFPERDYHDVEAARFALADLVPPEGVIVARFGPEPSYIGKSLADIAELRQTEAPETLLALIREARAWEAETGFDGESMLGHSMHPDDVATILRWPWTNLSSDGALGGRHPRGFGSFPRLVAQYGPGAAGGMSLEQAVHKMTGLAARNVGLGGRGLLEAGYRADLVLFDPATLRDRATVEQPQLTSRGIAGVWVNGVRVWDGRRWTDERPGEMLRGPAHVPPRSASAVKGAAPARTTEAE
jgi:N-acyl-D-amino-acid deacylase